MKMQRVASGPVKLMPLVAITLVNYAAQVPYYLHNDYSPHHVLPGVRAVALMAATLAWFALGLAGFARHRRWGLPVLASFLAAEAIFYAGTVATGIFIYQLDNHSYLLKTIFVIGYLSGAAAAYYLFRLLRERAPRRLRRGARQMKARAI